MIQHSAFERFCGGSQSARRPEIGLAWTSIAARMVMREKYPDAAMDGGIDDDPAQRKVDAAGIAVMPRNVQATVLIVYVRNPKALAALTFVKAAGKERAGRSEAIELQREFGTLIPHRIAVAARAAANDANRVGIEG